MDIPEIGRVIAQARLAAELSQAELAVAVALGKTTISELERGVISDLGIRKLQTILEFLNIEIRLVAMTRPTLNELVLASARQGIPMPGMGGARPGAVSEYTSYVSAGQGTPVAKARVRKRVRACRKPPAPGGRE